MMEYAGEMELGLWVNLYHYSGGASFLEMQLNKVSIKVTNYF